MTNSRKIIVDVVMICPFDQRVLMQKRSSTRLLFPNMWDLIGGHLESGETIHNCLTREIFEESKLIDYQIQGKLCEFEWEAPHQTTNLVYLATGSGEVTPEKDKVSEIRWLSFANVIYYYKQRLVSNAIFEAIQLGYKRYNNINDNHYHS